MDFRQRLECVAGKIDNYKVEVYGLRDAGVWYQLGFGLLLLILFPVLIVELLLVLLIGKDIGVFVPATVVEPPVLIEAEIPESLRDLIPLARKFGIGCDAERGDIMKAASLEELSDLESRVMPRQQEIADWLDTYPETEISDTAAFFLYLGSACDEVPLYIAEQEQGQIQEE
ncbi:MAG: hypothetical protein ABW080_05830 [Candidatus Thiodiazotropha sp.]